MPQFIVFLLCVFAVVQPPYVGYVPNANGQVAQHFGVSSYIVPTGDVAIVAHAAKAGKYFDELKIGDKITLIYANKSVMYAVATIERYQVTPGYTFRKDGGGALLSEFELFDIIYKIADHRLVLQTCYDGANGRLFVIAYPAF